MSDDAVRFEIAEPRETPWLGVFFGYVAMAPLVLGVLAFWLAPEAWRSASLGFTLFWGAAIVTFLSGVRRGVSFRTPGGTTASQIVTMLWLFCLGFGATILTVLVLPLPATLLLLLGFLTLGILDPIAARSLEAPLYFARLRPAQMAIPVVCLMGTAVLLVLRQA